MSQCKYGTHAHAEHPEHRAVARLIAEIETAIAAEERLYPVYAQARAEYERALGTYRWAVQHGSRAADLYDAALARKRDALLRAARNLRAGRDLDA